MILDPPWVTVIPDAPTLVHCLGDPRERAAAGALELRLDLWPEPPRLGDLAAIPGTKIVTWRRGGTKESERLRFLKDLLAGKAGDLWIDLDVEDPAAVRGLSVATARPEGVRVLMSRHFDRPATDAALRGAARNLLRPGVDAGKLVIAAGDFPATVQALRLSEELRAEAIPCTVFAGGISGTFSRFAAVARGDRWGYGRAAFGSPVVPGQPVVSTIETRYGGGFPSGESGAAEASSPFVCVIGSDVSGSISPGFHNRLLAEAGRRDRWFDLSVDDPAPLLATEGVEPWPPRAFAVTAPHKLWARRQGRAGAPGEEMHVGWNTLVGDGDGWLGWNTDVPAFLDALERAQVRVEDPVLVLGAGGTAQPIALALARRGTPVWILRRSRSSLPDALAEARVIEVEADAIGDAQVLVNTTGATERLTWPIEGFTGTLAVEYLYAREETDFLSRATARGAAAVPGVELFAEQARLQARIIHGIEIEADAARVLAERALVEANQ